MKYLVLSYPELYFSINKISIKYQKDFSRFLFDDGPERSQTAMERVAHTFKAIQKFWILMSTKKNFFFFFCLSISPDRFELGFSFSVFLDSWQIVVSGSSVCTVTKSSFIHHHSIWSLSSCRALRKPFSSRCSSLILFEYIVFFSFPRLLSTSVSSQISDRFRAR